MSRVEQCILLFTHRVVRQWWIIQNLQKPAENLGKPAAEVSGRFPAGFRIIHHWRTTRYIIFRKREKKKSYIVLHKGRWRFFCRLKHILPVVRFPFPVKFLIRPLGVGLQLPAPLHQLPVWYVQQFGWLMFNIFSMNFFDSPDSSLKTHCLIFISML